MHENPDRYTPEQREEAILDYYSTPAGLSLFDTRKGQSQDTTDLMYTGGMVVNVEEFRALAEAYRDKKLAALKDESEHEDHEPVFIENCDEFLPDDEVRADKEDVLKAYEEESISFVNRIPAESLVPLRWVTSDGSGVMNTYLVKGYEGVKENYSYRLKPKYDEEGNEIEDPDSLYSEENIVKAVDSITKMISENRRPEPIVVYRGLQEDMFSEEFQNNMHKEGAEDFCFNEVKQKFVPGEVYQMQNFASTSVSPKTAMGFSGSDVVLEIKTRSVIPLGGVSNWGFGEKEMLANRGVKYRVLGVKRVPYQRKNDTKTMTVVQLEEIED